MQGLHGVECEWSLVVENSPRTTNIETGPQSGHHKELNSANQLNDLGEGLET